MINERIEDGIIIATFDYGKTNSITRETLGTLRSIVKKANEDDSIKGIVLTGAGRTFSSGFDLPMFLGFKDRDEIIEFFYEEEEILIELFMCRKPVVSAINGHAIAGGLLFAMATDYRIVKNHPKINLGMSEIKLGLPLSFAQSGILQFGLDSGKKFRDLIYFGGMMDVKAALEFGIVDEIVDEAELLDRAKKIVSTWIDNPGRAFMKLKEGLKKSTADSIRQKIERENWQDSLNCFFDPEVRTSLEFVMSMMKG
ncbi:MAG: enoyl-CoA hydratase/isomerase family protein [Desulfomonilia bacterium]